MVHVPALQFAASGTQANGPVQINLCNRIRAWRNGKQGGIEQYVDAIFSLKYCKTSISRHKFMRL